MVLAGSQGVRCYLQVIGRIVPLDRLTIGLDLEHVFLRLLEIENEPVLGIGESQANRFLASDRLG